MTTTSQEKDVPLPPSPLCPSSRTTTAAETRVLLRKVDSRILPILGWLYLLLLMDRVNIGNARILGLEVQLKMKEGDYGITLSLLLLAQVLFVVPGNLAMKKIRPSLWLGGLCVCWGKSAFDADERWGSGECG
jgi:hypothetical protein